MPPWETKFISGEVIIFREYTLPDKYAKKKRYDSTWEPAYAKKMTTLAGCWEAKSGRNRPPSSRRTFWATACDHSSRGKCLSRARWETAGPEGNRQLLRECKAVLLVRPWSSILDCNRKTRYFLS